MLVRCKKYSVNYPTGIQNAGDIFELTKSQAIHFSQVGWVEADQADTHHVRSADGYRYAQPILRY